MTMAWARRPRGVERLLLAVVVGAAFVGGCSSSDDPATAPTGAAGLGPTSTTPVGACDANAVATKILPSVVTIVASTGAVGATGAGEIIRETGEILTNDHVVASGAGGGRIEVLFNDGTTTPATVVGRDPQTDLAVVRVDVGKPLPAIAVGTSSSVEIGQPVVAVGAPLGLAGTVTAGIVSALGRTVQVPAADGTTAVLLSALQTDAAINPGNSGGALADCEGRLIGVTSANMTATDAAGQPSGGSDGLGFAIPVDLATAVADQLITTGAVTHSYVGIEVREIPASATGDPAQPGGIHVTVVEPGGPAAAAGLLAGDVITAVDGQAVTDAEQLAAVTLLKGPGETVTITYLRAGASTDAVVTLGAPPTG